MPALGITRAQLRTELRRERWQRLGFGAYLTTHEAPTRADWAESGVLIAGADSAVTGWDALHACGLTGRVRAPDEVVVLSRVAMDRRIGCVRIRRTSRPYRSILLPEDADTLALTPLVAAPRAAADAALLCATLGDVRAIVSNVVQRGRGTVEQLLAEYETGPRNRSGWLRTALFDLLDGARSAAEGAALRVLATGRVPDFELNVPVENERGEVVFVADVLWRELRAILEIDSVEYHFREQDWKRTLARHNALVRCGFALTHYPPSDVGQPGWLPQI